MIHLNHTARVALLFMLPWSVQAQYALSSPNMALKAIPAVGGYRVVLERDGQALLHSPSEGMWSIGQGWDQEWPASWIHGQPDHVEQQGPWLVLTGKVETPQGAWQIRDAYRLQAPRVQGIRRMAWTGAVPLPKTTLSIRWQIPAEQAQALLPGICYYGNPSGEKTDPRRVAMYHGHPGEQALFEEHRYPAPFACLEWGRDQQWYGAALHSLPSMVPHAHRADQWWSLGVRARPEQSELLLLSGPLAANGEQGVVKARQQRFIPYPGAWMDIPPGAVIEKTFWLEAFPVRQRGQAFRTPLRTSIEAHQPYAVEAFPSIREILEAKVRFARSRWYEDEASCGFRMFPHNNDYVMGWAGQSAAPGYALLQLAAPLGQPDLESLARRALDFLSTSPFNRQGFQVRYTPEKQQWSKQDPVSQGQGMENFARAIRVGRTRTDIDTTTWEVFLRRACEVHADRILAESWRPVSTNEGFLVAPLCHGYELFGEERFKTAALHAARHYRERHLDMQEPYWGGTLDARCEDKEGAWAGFQAFLAAYELTRDRAWLEAAAHAMDTALTYTYLWDVDLPPGRLRDHALKTRGWTNVSAQNQHLDVYAVVFTPEVYRMGRYLERDDLKELAQLMYRSCGQMLDPFGSQGEQLQHTNFVQHQADKVPLEAMRGGYAESWTVLWMTSHFLNAAAQFQEMGVWPEASDTE